MDLSKAQSKPGPGDRSEAEREKAAEESALHLSLKGPIASDDNDTTTDGSISLPMPTPKPAASHLTIFYGGTVSVYDAVPPEKAHAIMLIAAATAVAEKTSANNTAAAAATAQAAPAAPVLTRTLSLLSSSAAAEVAPVQPHVAPEPSGSVCKLQAELPIARRHSLQRFLQKRRDRVVSKAPYASAKTSDNVDAAPEGQPQLL